MVLLAGPRQVETTTVAQALPAGRDGYLNWDVAEHRERILRRELPASPLWVFDEIHKYRGWRNWLKGIYDGRPARQRVLVTGSARLESDRFSGGSPQGRYHLLRLPELVGSLLSLNALRGDLDVSHRTVACWLDILERLYAIFRIAPFGSPKLRAIRKSQKHYHFDWSVVGDPGPRFENLVASHLLKWVHFQRDVEGRDLELRYFRDTDGREVDFVVIDQPRGSFRQRAPRTTRRPRESASRPLPRCCAIWCRTGGSEVAMPHALIAALLLLPAGGGAPPVLAASSFEALAAEIRPSAADRSFLAIPWRATFWSAVVEADAADRPILLWAMNGHPLACT